MPVKYTLSSSPVTLNSGKKVYRVLYSDGTKGGFVSGTRNLSQDGSCKVLGIARVIDNARVSGAAIVDDEALLCEDAQVYGSAKVYGEAFIHGQAKVYGSARVYGHAAVSGDAKIYGKAHVYENARVMDSGAVYEQARVFGDARVFLYGAVHGDAQVFDTASVYGFGGEVWGGAKVYGRSHIYAGGQVAGNAIVCGDAEHGRGFLRSGILSESEDTRKAREADAARRQEVVDELVYSIEHCPRGTRHTIIGNIASLLLSFDDTERSAILDLYEEWRGAHGGTFAPRMQQIADEVNRRRASQRGEPVVVVQPSASPGFSRTPTRHIATDFLNDMENMSRAREIARWSRGIPEEPGY